MAFDLVMSPHFSPWSACRSSPDLRADHPLICVQINPWSACRSPPDMRADRPLSWSMCRSPTDMRAYHSLICVQIMGERARPLLAKAPPGSYLEGVKAIGAGMILSCKLHPGKNIASRWGYLWPHCKVTKHLYFIYLHCFLATVFEGDRIHLLQQENI